MKMMRLPLLYRQSVLTWHRGTFKAKFACIRLCVFVYLRTIVGRCEQTFKTAHHSNRLKKAAGRRKYSIIAMTPTTKTTIMICSRSHIIYILHIKMRCRHHHGITMSYGDMRTSSLSHQNDSYPLCRQRKIVITYL